MERETGIEPATASLGNWPQFENTEHGVYAVYFRRLSTPVFSTGSKSGVFNGVQMDNNLTVGREFAKECDCHNFKLCVRGRMNEICLKIKNPSGSKVQIPGCADLPLTSVREVVMR